MTHWATLLLPNMLAMLAGNSRTDDAKMGGMTPAVFTLSGRCELCPL